MDKARKPDRAGPKAPKGPGPQAGPSPEGRREVRVDRKALALVVAAGVLVIPGLLALRAFQGRSVRSALLIEAKKQRDEARRPDLALGYFNRYLELAPDDLEALDQRAVLLADAAREPDAIEGAIRAHSLLLGKQGDGPGRGETLQRLAGLYLRSKQFRAAEESARDLLRREPGQVEGHRLLARALEGSGRMGDVQALEASVAEYEAAEALKPGDVASGERLASLYLDKFGDKARATRVLDALLEHNPASVAARLARSRVLASMGEPFAASNEIETAIQVDPADVDARLAAAEAAARRDDPAAARRHLDAIQPPRPDDLRVKIVRGQIELGERKADRAIQEWRDGLAMAGGTDAELTWRLAHVLIQLGRVVEAEPLISQYRRLSGEEESPPAARYLVGLSLLKSGRVAEASAELEAIRYKIDKGLEGLVHLALGQAYEASLEPAKAADAYAKAATSGGAGESPWLALARLLAADRPDEPVVTLERGIAAVGPNERLLAELARALWRKQVALPADKRDWAEFDQILEQGRSVAPDSADLALVRADRLAASGRPNDGLTSLDASIRHDPASGPLRMARIEALIKLGRNPEAIRALDEAVASVGDQTGFRIVRARIALASGEVKAARLALVEGLDRVPREQKPMLLKAIGEFHATQADRPAARRAYLDWASLVPDSVDPHLSLLGLAIEAGDDRSVDREVESLKTIGGPSSPTWKIARAEALLRERQGSPPSPASLKEAERLIAEIQATAPRQPAGVLLEARLREYRREPDRAIRAYDKALDLKAGPLAIKPWASLLAGLGRLDELELLRARVGGFSPDVERMLASMALRQGKPDEAETLARKMVEGDPASLDARAWQAAILDKLGKPDEAEAALRKLVETRPEAPAAWLQLLMFQVARKDRAGAASTIERMKGRVKVERPDLLVANCARASGLRDLADRAMLDALRAFPDDVPTLRSAVDHCEATGRPEQAEPLLRRLRKDNPGLDWARRRLALNLAGRPGDRASWREALELAGESPDPSDTPDDRLTRGVILSLGPEDRRGEAVGMLERLALEMPEATRVREALARALLSIGDRPKARENADRAARGVDASPETIRLAASLDLLNGDPEAASRLVARLEPIGLDDPASLELKARALKASGKASEAVASVERAYDSPTRTGDGVEQGRGVVRLLTSLDEPEGAERVARKVAGVAPLGQVVLAEWLGSRGKFDEASAAYDEASKTPKGAREAARSALTVASTAREPRWSNLADRLLDRACGPGPLDDELTYARAALRHLQGRLEEAVKLYDDLAARTPANLIFLNNGAWILSEELGRPLDGLNRIETLVAKAGAPPHTLDTRGVILLRLGRLDHAIADLEAAAKASPTGPIGYHLARAYLASGRRDDAARTLARARDAGLTPGQLQTSELAEFARVETAVK